MTLRILSWRPNWKNIALGFAALVIGLVVIAFMVARTQWFRDFVRQKLLTAAEEGTGGRVEIGSFTFDPLHLRAVVTGFVIHGHEPAGAVPYLSARRAEVDLRLLTSFKHTLDIAYLGLNTPQANILVFPDGSTNVPTPKTKSQSNQTPLETVVDLAVGRLDVTNGLITFNSTRQPLNVRASNLRVQLAYNAIQQGYQGIVSLEPLYVLNGRNTPVNFSVSLPLTFQRDHIDFRNAKIATAQSQIQIDGSLQNLRAPRVSAHLNGRLALADLKNAGNLPLDLKARHIPGVVDFDASATVADNVIQIAGLHLGMGHSTLEASGKLKDASGSGSLAFKAQLALGELARLAAISSSPEGTVVLNGTAKLDSTNNYQVAGNIAARDVSLRQIDRRLAGIGILSVFRIDPHRIDLQGLRLTAPGAELAANASLEDFARFNVDGNIRRLDLPTVAHTFGQNLPYDGSASGVIAAHGNLKAPGLKSIDARANLTIAAGRRGIPLKGVINASYDGAANNVALHDSYLALPHTRIDLSGSLATRLNVALDSRDLHDLTTAAPGAPPVSLNGGQLNLRTAVTGRLTAPAISGHLAMDRFQVEDRYFDALALDFEAAGSGASVANGNLSRGAEQTYFQGTLGMRDWQPQPNSPLAVQASIRGGDLADLMALAGQPTAGYSGAVTADANVTGTMGNPGGAADIQIANGTVQSEPFDNLIAQLNFADQLITIPSASIASGASRVNLTAEFHHPRDSFGTGRLRAHLQSNQVDLARLRTAEKQLATAAGQIQFDADIVGNLSSTGFLATAVNADLSGRSLRYEGQVYGDLTATARTSGPTVTYSLNSDFAGASVRVNGNTRLEPGYQTTADANIVRLPIDRAFALAKQDVPAKGTLSATAHVTGTLDKPEGTVGLDLTNAVLYNEPVDHIRARATSAVDTIDVSQFEVTAGPSRVDLTASYRHAPGHLDSGNFEFRINNSRVDLSHIHNLQQVRPGMAGALQINAAGEGAVAPTGPRVVFHGLNVDIAAKGIAAQGKNLGDLTLAAKTTSGRLDFTLNSNLAGSTIQGNGSATLSGNYPVNAKIAFDNVTFTKLQPLLGQSAGTAPGFEALGAGQVEVNGPILKTDELRGSLELTRVQFQTTAQPGVAGRQVAIENQGPVTITLDRGAARIQSLHLAGGQTDLQVTGTYTLQTQAITGNVKANADLDILQRLSRDIVSSGTVTLSADARGTLAKPQINGRLELHNATANYTGFANGISNANGAVQFNGNSAALQNVTAEVGGGKVTLAGFVAYSDVLRFGVHVNGSNMRLRVQPGVSVVAEANLQLTGGRTTSRVTGTAVIDQISYAPTSDFGAILSRAAPPVQNAAAPSPLLDNMKLDIQVRTSPSLSVQAAMAENLQLDANLQVRGTAFQPGVLGRISLNEGQLVFFSSTYTVNSGTVSFYNPLRIEPILNLSLETMTQGVDVVLKVTGPIDNMNLSYTSDPPLQFQEIVGLLAAGKTPTSDPNILVNQPTAPPQSFQEMGETAIVSQALANPVAGRLQRVFGVSQLSIDPTFSSGSDLPQAQLKLKQQISTSITFTYVTALNDTNTQIVQVEWALNPQWSAIGGRDQNGVVSLRVIYKKQFR